jgi:hypothetical protein
MPWHGRLLGSRKIAKALIDGNGSPRVCVAGCTSRCCVACSPGFDAELVVDRYSQTLSAANIAFSGLNRAMPEEKLDMFKLASGIMAEPRTEPAQIMRR